MHNLRKIKSLPAFIGKVNTDMNERYDNKTSRLLKLSGASITANILLGLGKLALGIYTMSFFVCVSAMYTFGMVVAKYFALAGIIKSKTIAEQYRYYFLSGTILIVASLAFIGYSVRVFFHPVTTVYHMYVALLIASFTFFEITVNIRGVIVERHNHTPLFHALRTTNLASSLICLVLTQAAILSFADTQSEIHPTANGIIGVAMGCLALMLGINMVLRIKRIQKGTDYPAIIRQLKRLMKKEGMPYRIEPIKYIINAETDAKLYIRIIDEILQSEVNWLCLKTEEKLDTELVIVEYHEWNKRSGI